jgi:hypothetical protein
MIGSEILLESPLITFHCAGSQADVNGIGVDSFLILPAAASEKSGRRFLDGIVKTANVWPATRVVHVIVLILAAKGVDRRVQGW